MLRVALLLWLAALPLRAEEVVLGLSKDRVAITATFEGSDILIFGAIKRETAIPEVPLDVIITVSGPSRPATVRRHRISLVRCNAYGRMGGIALPSDKLRA